MAAPAPAPIVMQAAMAPAAPAPSVLVPVVGTMADPMIDSLALFPTLLVKQRIKGTPSTWFLL